MVLEIPHLKKPPIYEVHRQVRDMYDYVCVSIILSPHEVGRFHFTPAVVYFKSNLADIGGDIRLTIVAHNCSHCHHKTVWWFMFFLYASLFIIQLRK